MSAPVAIRSISAVGAITPPPQANCIKSEDAMSNVLLSEIGLMSATPVKISLVPALALSLNSRARSQLIWVHEIQFSNPAIWESPLILGSNDKRIISISPWLYLVKHTRSDLEYRRRD